MASPELPPPPPPLPIDDPRGLPTSADGDVAPPLLILETVAARLLGLMKEGRKELRGDVGDAMPPPVGVARGVPLGEWATKGEIGSGIWVGRLLETGRDILVDRSVPFLWAV